MIILKCSYMAQFVWLIFVALVLSSFGCTLGTGGGAAEEGIRVRAVRQLIMICNLICLHSRAWRK